MRLSRPVPIGVTTLLAGAVLLEAAGVVLVLNSRPSSPPAVRARVPVSGDVRAFSCQELGLLECPPASAETTLEARHAGRPVVVSDSIRTSDGREVAVEPSLS